MCSRIVFKLICLFTLDFKSMSAFANVGEITVAPYIVCLSSAFYLAVFILLILIFKSVRKLKNPTYTLKEKHFTNRVFKIRKIAALFIAATMLILPVFGPYDKDEGMTVKTPQYVRDITIAQSDTPCPISEISPEDGFILHTDYDWSNYFDSLDYYYINTTYAKNITENITINDGHKSISPNFITQKCGNKFQYKIAKFDIPLVVTKDYVYVEFVSGSSSYKTQNKGNWYKADTAPKITAAIDDYNQVEITISKAE